MKYVYMIKLESMKMFRNEKSFSMIKKIIDDDIKMKEFQLQYIFSEEKFLKFLDLINQENEKSFIPNDFNNIDNINLLKNMELNNFFLINYNISIFQFPYFN